MLVEEEDRLNKLEVLKALEGVKELDFSNILFPIYLVDYLLTFAKGSSTIEDVKLCALNQKIANSFSNLPKLKSVTLLGNKWSDEEISRISPLIDIVAASRAEYNEKLVKEICSGYNFLKPLATIIQQYFTEIAVSYEISDYYIVCNYTDFYDVTLTG